MYYDKDVIRDNLTLSNIFNLVEYFGGEPKNTSFGFTARTICHNPSHEGSRKLYYYEDSKLFKCYTECDDSFDIFTLVQKVMDIQRNKQYSFYDAVKYVGDFFNIEPTFEKEEEIETEDWKYIRNYSRIKEIKINNMKMAVLDEYDDTILKNFNYDVLIRPWMNENISQEVMKDSMIGYYPVDNCITIPHFDINGRFIGLRGRTLIQEEAEKFGKYRPLFIDNILYSHPIGLNLYNINKSKDNIQRMKTAIIFESEKSTLQYKSYFGFDNDISVACCGSSISQYQINILLYLGAREIVIAFDRQFQNIGDNEFKALTKKIKNLHNKYKNYVNISFIFDKKMITSYKSSPTDEGPDKFLTLYKNRIFL